MYKIVRVLFALFSMLVLQYANAGTTFNGAFELNDYGSVRLCNNANIASGSCSCAGGEPALYNLRVINDSGIAPKVLAGSNLAICASNNKATTNLAGVFQLDDGALGGVGCRVPNAETGACSCPAGATLISTRVVSDNPQSMIGTKIGICVRQTVTPSDFGGAYQMDDPVPNALACRAANPLTGACSCPSGFVASPIRVIADNGPHLFGSHVYTCNKATTDVTICPGVMADPSGNRSASAAIAQCVANTADGKELELPVGNYRMTSQLVLSKAITLRTKGSANLTTACGLNMPCAALVADANFNAKGGVVVTTPKVSGVKLDHIIIDGNRSARIGSDAYYACKDVDKVTKAQKVPADPNANRWGFNVNFEAGCTNCAMTYSASNNALCGTGVAWLGDNALILSSRFMNNGDNGDSRMWADGLTLLQSSNARVEGNTFTDNSDIGFIYGGGTNSTVRYNYVVQKKMRAFAGLMLDNFGPNAAGTDSNTSGDFRGTTIGPNSIICDNCYFGVNIGPHPWYLSKNLIGGSFTSNSISGGYINLNVDGAGTAANPMTIAGNTLGPIKIASPACKVGGTPPPSVAFNASSDSILSAASSIPNSRVSTDLLISTCDLGGVGLRK